MTGSGMSEPSFLKREVDFTWFARVRAVILKLLWPCTPLLALLALFPWPYQDPDIKIDYSWSLVLQHVHGSDLVFGRDLMLNYGAWGFAFFGSLPETRAVTMLCWVLLSQLMVLGIVGATRAHSRRFLGLTSAWIALLVLSIPLPDVRVLSFAPILYALGAFDADRKHMLVGEIGIGTALGWVVTMKFSSFVIAIPVLVAHTYDQWVLRRRISLVIPLFIGALLAAMIAAGQPITALGDWVESSMQNVIGYGTAGVAADRFHEKHPIALFVAGAAALGFAMTIYLFRTRRWHSIVPLTALALIFGVLLKAGYMRYDMGHQINAPLVFLVFVLVLTPGMVAKGRRPEQMLFAVSLLIAIYSANLVMNIDRRRDLPTVFTEQSWHVKAGLRNFVERERGVREFHENKMERIRKKYPLARGIEEPVDIYSYMQSVVYAHGLEYAPRPAFQSYFAWTRFLATANEQHLRRSDAARSILFAIEPIDGRFPTFADSLSYPTLLELYEPWDVTDDFLLLRRRGVPLQVRLEPFAVIDGRIGETVELPASDRPLWATIHVDLSTAGRLMRLMLRPPEIRLLANVGDGVEDYRFIPDYGEMGFLISPVVRDHYDLGRIFVGDRLEERALRSFRLTTGSTESDERLLKSYVRIELQTIEWGRAFSRDSVARPARR